MSKINYLIGSERVERLLTKRFVVTGDSDSGSVGSPINTSGSGHKPSFKASGKLARRARSFKEDFLEKLGAMRSPVGGATGGAGGGVRSHSPAPKRQTNQIPPSTPPPTGTKDRTSNTLDGLLRQVNFKLINPKFLTH